MTRKLLDRYAIAHPAHTLSRPQRRDSAAKASAPARRRRRGCARLGCRHAAHFRSRTTSSCGRRRRPATPSPPCPGASAAARRADGRGLADRSILLRRFPAAEAGRAPRPHRRTGRIPATLVLFETGPRLAATLADLAAALGEREAAVCRELTKLHEEVRRGRSATLAQSERASRNPRRIRSGHRAAHGRHAAERRRCGCAAARSAGAYLAQGCRGRSRGGDRIAATELYQRALALAEEKSPEERD